jgi:hypothetical protein
MRPHWLATLLAFAIALPLHAQSPSPATRTRAPERDASVPAENQPSLQTPPERPAASEVQNKARALFDAIVHDDPEQAMDSFFPREAFLKVKAIADPGRYYDQLRARFIADIHALHRETPDLAHATFSHLELVKRGGWVKVGEEANRLPYWASRHCWLHYNVGPSQRKLEVRVLITWGTQWYVIHLSEFRGPRKPLP